MSLRSPLGAAPGSGSLELVPRGLRAGGAPAARGRRATLGTLGLGGLILATATVALSAANTDVLLPESVRPIPDWLAGPFGGAGPDLGHGGVIAVLSLLFGAYWLTVRNVSALSARAVLGTVAGLNALVLLAPPLLSTDVFSYMAYGRIGALYHANPYVLGPHAFALDPIYPFVGAKWVTIPTAYGPVFTVLSYPVAALDVLGSVIAYKLIAAVSAILVVAAVWQAARIRGIDQVRAAALVGLNPLLVVFGVGGAHNDLLMLAGMTGAVYLLLTRRDRAGGTSIVAAAGVKLTAGILLPFAVAGHPGVRRRAVLSGALIAAASLLALSLALFGVGTFHLFATLQRSQSSGDWHSVPGFISTRLGLGLIGHVTGLVLAVGFAGTFVWLVDRVRRGRMDWIAGAGWATFAMLVTASSLLPWYVVWLLPFAALSADRRLVRATVGLTGAVLVIQLVGYLPHAGSFLGL